MAVSCHIPLGPDANHGAVRAIVLEQLEVGLVLCAYRCEHPICVELPLSNTLRISAVLICYMLLNEYIGWNKTYISILVGWLAILVFNIFLSV